MIPSGQTIDAGPSRATRLKLWFAQLGGGAAWTLHLLGAYLTAEFGCVSGLGRQVALGLMLPAWILIALTLAALGLAAAAMLVARRLGREPRALAAADGGAVAFAARAGVATSGLFTAIIAVQSVPILFYLGGC